MDKDLFDYWDFRSECFSAHKKLVAALKPAAPFEIALSDVFKSVLSKLGYLLSLNAGMHIFVNPHSNIGLHRAGLFHLITSENARYTECPLPEGTVSTGIPVLNKTFWQNAQNYFANLPCVQKIDSVEKGIFMPMEPHPKDVTIVRLTAIDSGKPYNLGFCLLWNDPKKAPVRGPTVSMEHLDAWIREVQTMLITQLRNVFDVQAKTYLPAYRMIGNKRVVVLFADIRNFSTVTEILRNKGRFNNLTTFLNRFCDGMAQIIAKYGRLDKFIGDGIMALFGEYATDPHEVCGRALLCAKEMCEAFDRNKEIWFSEKDVTMLKFMQENNENVDLQLGIGLNIGEVHFDYYGAPGRQEYTAIGDHVNFAQRLESLASQLTEVESGRRREPIAVSQSFFHQLSGDIDGKSVPFLNSGFTTDDRRSKPTFLNVKGLGLRYPVHLLKCADIDEHGIRRYLATKDQ